MKKLIFAFLIVSFLAGSVWADEMKVKLSWDANTEADLAGYRVYYGMQSGQYLQTKGAGLDAGLNTQFVISGLEYGTMYYFAVTAYDNETPSLESGYSEEVFTDGVVKLPPVPPNVPNIMQIEITRPDGTTIIINIP